MVTSVLPEGYKYLVEDEKFSSPTNYECNLRIRALKTEEDARKWIDALNECSLVTWKVLRTYPNSGKINIYKGEFRCQHRVHGKRKDIKKSKNTNCPARLRVCVRRYLKSTNAKIPDPLTKLWPCIIELKNIHNHSVESADSLQYRPVNDVTRKKITDLFQLGHSPHSITELLRLDLLIENPEAYEERENDASFCPLPGFCYREYIRVFGNSYRGRLKNSLQAELESLLSPYINDTEGGRAVMSSVSDHLVVCICTPIMQNTHCLVPESRSIIHLHIFGHPDKKSKCFMFTTWINIGEVPLGVILTDTEEPDVFTTGIQLLKSIFPPGSFFGSGYPEVFILPDDDSPRKGAMEQEFPLSIILTSKFHQLRQFQDFLLDSKHSSQMSRELHTDLYKKFKIMLNSVPDDFGPNFEKVSCDMKYLPGPGPGESRATSQGQHAKHPGESCQGQIVNPGESGSQESQLDMSQALQQYLNQMWMDSNGFAHVYRPGIFICPPEECPAPEGVQILSRLILSELFDRVKSFNLVQLSHFIIRTFEEFMRRRLASPSYVESLLKIFLPGKGTTNLYKVRKIEEAFFEVPSEGADPTLVDMELLRCTSCQRSRICSHVTAVIQKFYSISIPYPVHHQELYFDIAGGESKLGQYSRAPKALPKGAGRRHVSAVRHLVPKIKGPGQGTGPAMKVPKAEDSIDAQGTHAQGTQAQELISEVGEWLQHYVTKNPVKFIPALKNMIRKMESMDSDSEAVAAVASFGTRYTKPIEIRQPPVVQPCATIVQPCATIMKPVTTFLELEPPLETIAQAQDQVHEQDLTFIMQEEGVAGIETEDLMAEISNNTTYLPLQEIPGEDGNPAYFILVTNGDETKGIFSTDEVDINVPEISCTSIVQNFEEVLPLPVSVVQKRKPNKKILTANQLLGL